MSADRLSLILCTVPDVVTGRTIADVLLQEKLAACVSILPGLESHYIWKEKREQAEESLLLIKSPVSQFIKLSECIQKNHPYECPEIVQIKDLDALPAYAQWVIQSCSLGE